MREQSACMPRKPCQSCNSLCSDLFLPCLRNSASLSQIVSQDPAVGAGTNQFEQACGFCHGPDAQALGGPDLSARPLVAHDVKGDKIAKSSSRAPG